MTAIGIDLGGTKIEVQLFNDNWAVVARNRVATPSDYPALVKALGDQVRWAQQQQKESTAVNTTAVNPTAVNSTAVQADTDSMGALPVGIGAAGLLNPVTQLALTANLPASGKPFLKDIESDIGQTITYVNDCRALALSEAIFGAGISQHTVVALILGTGVGGGVTVGGKILNGPSMTGGEFGHTAAPAHLVARHNLPIFDCGCGRVGCVETYIAGPGLERLCKALSGQDLTPPQIAARRKTDMADTWSLWCEMTAELLHNITVTVDPDVIILGGGLSQIDGVIDDLMAAAKSAQIGDFKSAKLLLAQGGDSSGARGAAFAAWQEQAASANTHTKA